MTIDRRELIGAAGALGLLAATGSSAQPSATATRSTSTMPVINVHTHMFSNGWMARVYEANDPDSQLGEGQVMYGSDYPFRLGDMSGLLARVDALPDDQRDAIRGGNALKLFDL